MVGCVVVKYWARMRSENGFSAGAEAQIIVPWTSITQERIRK